MAVRSVETSIGDGVKGVREAEKNNMPIVRKSIVAARDLPAGHVISADDICAKRAG